MDIFLFNKRNKIRPKFLNPIYGFRKNGRIDFYAKASSSCFANFSSELSTPSGR